MDFSFYFKKPSGSIQGAYQHEHSMAENLPKIIISISSQRVFCQRQCAGD